MQRSAIRPLRAWKPIFGGAWCEWQSHGRIDPFPLGADDLSDRLLIPEKLYGREREVDALLAAFDRVVAQGTAELVLVSGYSGVGKSSVVNELHKVLVPPRGLFAAGKFDQYKRDVPYATLAQAFQMLVRQILVKSEAEVDHWRHALLEALGPNGELIVNLIPEVEFVIGKQPPVAELPPQEARGRFQLVFRRFLGAFATAGASAGVVPGRSAMAGHGNSGIAGASDYRSGRAARAADRSLPRQRSQFVSSADADAGRDPRRGSEGAGNRAGASRAR